MGLRSWIHTLTTPRRYSEAYFNSLKDVKFVCLVNNELKMGKGKIAAQVGHASVKAALLVSEKHPAECKHGYLVARKKLF